MKKLHVCLIISVLFLSATGFAQLGNETLGASAGAGLTTGDYNTFIGDSAGKREDAGLYNTYVGSEAGAYTTGADFSTFMGYQAGQFHDDAQDCTYIGYRAGRVADGTDNSFIGKDAGLSTTTGYDNTFVGEEAGEQNTVGHDNVYVGEDAGRNFVDGEHNVFVGTSAGYGTTVSDKSNGDKNTGVGYQALYDINEGSRNTGLGDSAGTDIGDGNGNTMIGHGSGAATEHADYNTFVGAYAGYDNNRTNNTNDSNRNTYVGTTTGYSNRIGQDNVGMGAFADFGSSGQPTPWGDGAGSHTNRSRATFIGANADVGHNDVTMLGYSTRVDGQYGIAIGNEADLLNATGGIGMGYQAALSANGDYSVGIGYQANISENDAVGIGRSVDVDKAESVAIGANSIIQNDGAIVIGYGANSMDLIDNSGGDLDATNNIAIGYNATTSAFNSVAIGNAASAVTDNTMVLGGATNPLSVGIGTDTPNAYASLSLADTNKGLLVNRLTTAQKTTLGGNLTATDYGMIVYDTDENLLYFWNGTEWNSAIKDNLGDHTATTDIEVADNNLDFGNTEGVGVRFWNSNNYKISMGNSSDYQYGVVTDYSIKNDMNSTAGRGWTWGVTGQTPIAALDNTGKMQIANTMTIGAYTLPNTDGATDQVLSTDGSGIVTWVDATVNTDEQDLSLSNDILSLTNDATSVDLSGYLDNTDNQDLTMSNHILSLSNDATPIDLTAYVNTDTQLTEAQVDTYVSNNGYLTAFTEVDGDITNEIQDISLSGTNLSISSGSTIDLAALQDGTGSDNQDLTSATLTDTTLSIDIESGDAVNVDLSPLLTDLEDRVTALETVGTASGTDATPQKFNYQAVVNDSSGDVLANTAVSFQINILQGSSTGTTVYSETHSATTSGKGLTNLLIGDGTLVSGDFTTIDWGVNVYYLEIKADVTGGTSYMKLGTSQLVSVPYALHAQSADYVSGISSSKLKEELNLKDVKIKTLERKVEKLEAMMNKILNK